MKEEVTNDTPGKKNNYLYIEILNQDGLAWCVSTQAFTNSRDKRTANRINTKTQENIEYITIQDDPETMDYITTQDELEIECITLKEEKDNDMHEMMKQKEYSDIFD